MTTDRSPRKGRSATREAPSNGQAEQQLPQVNSQDDDPAPDEQGRDFSGADASFDPTALEASPDVGTSSPPPPTADPFDPANLGVSQDFVGASEVAHQWDVIQVARPSKEDVFRVHPTFTMKTVLLVLKRTNETYVVVPALQQALADESTCGLYTLFACVTKDGTPFLWPIRMADGDGKWNVWHESAWQVALKAQKRWARMQARQSAGHYVAAYDQKPPEQQQEPAWPDLPFRTWLELAFKGRMVNSLDHPVLKKLRLED